MKVKVICCVSSETFESQLNDFVSFLEADDSFEEYEIHYFIRDNRFVAIIEYS